MLDCILKRRRRRKDKDCLLECCQVQHVWKCPQLSEGEVWHRYLGHLGHEFQEFSSSSHCRPRRRTCCVHPWAASVRGRQPSLVWWKVRLLVRKKKKRGERWVNCMCWFKSKPFIYIVDVRWNKGWFWRIATLLVMGFCGKSNPRGLEFWIRLWAFEYVVAR